MKALIKGICNDNNKIIKINYKENVEKDNLKKEVNNILISQTLIAPESLKNIKKISPELKHIFTAEYYFNDNLMNNAIIKKYKNRQEFINEVNIMLKVDQLNIPVPSIYGIKIITKSSGKYINLALVMQRIEPVDMMDLLQQKTLTTENCYKIMKQLVNCANILHENNITHNDFKCENMIVTKNKDKIILSLIDFALSTSGIDDDYKHNIRFGTCHYYSPEMQYNKKCLAKANDVWCIGVIIYILLSKYYFPFVYDTNPEIKSCYQFYENSLPKINYGIIHRDFVAILQRIFVPEEQRIKISELKEIIYPTIKKIIKLRRLIRKPSSVLPMSSRRSISKKYINKN